MHEILAVKEYLVKAKQWRLGLTRPSSVKATPKRGNAKQAESSVSGEYYGEKRPTPSTTTTACSLKTTTPTLTLTTTAMQMLLLMAATSFEHREPQCLLTLGRSTSPPLDQFPVRVCSCPLCIINRLRKSIQEINTKVVDRVNVAVKTAQFGQQPPELGG